MEVHRDRHLGSLDRLDVDRADSEALDRSKLRLEVLLGNSNLLWRHHGGAADALRSNSAVAKQRVRNGRGRENDGEEETSEHCWLMRDENRGL